MQWTEHKEHRPLVETAHNQNHKQGSNPSEVVNLDMRSFIKPGGQRHTGSNRLINDNDRRSIHNHDKSNSNNVLAMSRFVDNSNNTSTSNNHNHSSIATETQNEGRDAIKLGPVPTWGQAQSCGHKVEEVKEEQEENLEKERKPTRVGKSRMSYCRFQD